MGAEDNGVYRGSLQRAPGILHYNSILRVLFDCFGVTAAWIFIEEPEDCKYIILEGE